MIPLLSSKKTAKRIEGRIDIVGVSHIKANLSSVLSELNKLNIDSNTLVFIEPRKNILIGKETCNKESIGYFFAKVLEDIMSKKASILRGPNRSSKTPNGNWKAAKVIK